MKNKYVKILFILTSVILVIPSIIYIAENRTILGFNTYYNFFITKSISKIISTIIYLILFVILNIAYIKIIKEKDMFSNERKVLKFTTIVGIIFILMLPWTSSDIFYYMGVGEIDSVYNQNPYYVTMKDYYQQNPESIEKDKIFEQGVNNYWSNTTVIYGPIAQLIFKMFTAISFKNIDICLLNFKIFNLIMHVMNCYLIYKLTHKQKFSIIYGLNPFILLEFIGMVHNDIIVVSFVLITLYFLLKKKNIILSVLFLALATGIKYFTILLLPVVIIYHFRKKELKVRFIKCIQYGIIFILIVILEYLIYFKDYRIFFAMLVQTSKYSKSIYSAILQINSDLARILQAVMQLIFIMYYVKFYIDLLTERKIKFYKIIKKYNTALILFILILTTCQQWYLMWLFATLMWQRPNTKKNIIGLSIISEIANSIYMFKSEWYIYDIYFININICLMIIWVIYTNKIKIKDRREQIEKISIN